MKIAKGIVVKRALAWSFVMAFLTMAFASCAPTQSNYEGAAVLGTVGAVAGGLIDKKNPWRGAVIGGAIGAVAGAGIAEVSKRASREALATGRPVVYERQTSNGWQKVEATPVKRNAKRCTVVKVYENGKLMSEDLQCE